MDPSPSTLSTRKTISDDTLNSILNGSLSSESTEDENIVSDFDIDFPDDQFRSSTPLPDNAGGSDSSRSPSLQTKSTTSLNDIEQQFAASQPHDLPSPQNTAQRRTRRMVVPADMFTSQKLSSRSPPILAKLKEKLRSCRY
ncbi:hypothetical protein J6590_077116 [Homalodisca vitripennis]|nr:hypothetical protein J6590_077116 [Homalodisca vitripennis]